MNFDLSEEQKALQSSVRKFAQTELPAIAKQIEETNRVSTVEENFLFKSWSQA